ncbi:myo-inositol oxygenase [Cricetulus griseus]
MAKGESVVLGPLPICKSLPKAASPAKAQPAMAQFLMVTVTLGCISLLYLLPGTQSGGLGRGLKLSRTRESPAKNPSSGQQPGHSSLRPVGWKPHHAPQPQGRGNPTLAMVHLLQNGGSRHPGPQRHLGPRRPHAQLLRVGCVLGTCQGPDPSLVYRPDVDPELAKSKDSFRNYTHIQFGGFSHKKMTVMEAVNMLDDLVDESDPDVDFPNSFHAFQTAEGIRKAHPDKDWFHLVGLLHDLGKILVLWGEPQWAVVGDTFPVGCRPQASVVFCDSTFQDNPDLQDPRYK